MSPHALTSSAAVQTRGPTTPSAPDDPEHPAMTILDDPLTHRESSRADASLHRLAQCVDESAVESVLRSILARRRAVRQARREQASRQARHENELHVQRALLGSGLSHLR